jgi:hypothetical protein
MKTFRVLAELSQLYEIEIEAESEEEAVKIAKDMDSTNFSPFIENSFEDDWQILEELTEEVTE